MNKNDKTPTALPAAIENKRDLTYAVPNVLLSYKEDNGIPVVQMRMGGPRQIEHAVSIEYSETAIDESNQLFVIKAKNRINVAGVTLDVLNDRIDGSKPVAPSAPTATEYMSKVGTVVMIYFSCNRDAALSETLGRTVFKVVRSRIVLP